MSHATKTFEYEQSGLSYTVTVYEVNGAFFADIAVNHGAMDVNAVYFGDGEFSGPSVSLNGPLNMNGAGSQFDGETVQWDNAVKLSDPGLGREGAEKATFVTEGETLTVELPIDSLDDIDFFGIRATSTTTDGGSIKAVSGDPETTDPEDPVDPEAPLHEKVYFNFGTDETGADNGGYFILSEEPQPNEFNVPALPEGTEPTFSNYLAYFEEIGGDVTQVQSVDFYETDENGAQQVVFTIPAPEGGFVDGEDLQNAYNAAIEGMDEGSDFIAGLTIDADPEETASAEDEEAELLSVL